MKWFKFTFRIVDSGQFMEGFGHIHGKSEKDARARKIAGLKKAGWFTDELKEFNLDLEFDERLTKVYDENGKWEGYS